jgi:hypothetical protein
MVQFILPGLHQRRNVVGVALELQLWMQKKRRLSQLQKIRDALITQAQKLKGICVSGSTDCRVYGGRVEIGALHETVSRGIANHGIECHVVWLFILHSSSFQRLEIVSAL